MTQKFADHLLFTCIDDSEPLKERGEINNDGTLSKNLGAQASELLAALLEETTIILVNSSLVHYLTRYLKEVNDNPWYLAKKINPQNWIKKKIDNYIYLLIPKFYAMSLPSYDKISGEILSKSPYTQDEVALGLKLTKKPDISDADFLDPTKHPDKKSYKRHQRKSILESVIETPHETAIYTTEIIYELSWISSQITKSLNDIFITNQEYANIAPSDSEIIPRWVVIASGHGSTPLFMKDKIKDLEKFLIKVAKSGGQAPKVTQKLEKLRTLHAQGKQGYTGGQVAGFNSKDFGIFAQFLDKHLTTKLLFFNTCYGAQVNIQEALIDIVDDVVTETPAIKITFPMISGAFSTASTHSGIFYSGFKGGYNTLTHPIFKNFIDMLNTSVNPNNLVLLDALQNVYLLSTKRSANNIPLVKLPTTDWQPLLPKNSYITIDAAFVQQQNNQPLNLYNKYPDLKFVFPDIFVIPFPVIITTTHMPTIISKTAGNVVHGFEKILADNIPFDRFIEAFFPIEDTVDIKAFFIKKLTVSYNQKPQNFSNVILVNLPQKNESVQKLVFFDDNGTTYMLDAKNITGKNIDTLRKKADPKLYKTVQNLFTSLPREIFARPKSDVATQAIDQLAQGLQAIVAK